MIVILLSLTTMLGALAALIAHAERRAVENQLANERAWEAKLQKYRAELCVQVDILTGVRGCDGKLSPPYGSPHNPAKWYANYEQYKRGRG